MILDSWYMSNLCVLGLVKCLFEGSQIPMKFPYPVPGATKRRICVPENSKQQWWLPELSHVSKSNNGDYRKRNPLMWSTQYSTLDLDHLSLLHPPTHSVPTASHPALSTTVWWNLESKELCINAVFVYFMSNIFHNLLSPFL